MKFKAISAISAPVRREGRKKGKDGNFGERPTREISPQFTFCLHQGTHRCSLHLSMPGKRKFRLSLSCGPAPKPPKPTQNEATHACPEKVCPTETIALREAWVGDANLNLTRARKESLTPPNSIQLPQGTEYFALPPASQKSCGIKISEQQARVSNMLDFRLFCIHVKLIFIAINPVS